MEAMFDWVDWVGLGILVLAAIMALGVVRLWPRGRNGNNRGNDERT